MSQPTYTQAELTPVFEHFGLYAAHRAQQLCAQHDGGWVPGATFIALGLRESGLRNVCGGAKLVNGVWVPVKTDRGWLQISDTIAPNRQFLASVLGCPDGSWIPKRGFTALEPLRCPTFSAASNYTLKEFSRNKASAIASHVPSADVLRFCVAAHNAGFTGALRGYRLGDVDKFTTHGDYSANVMANAVAVAAWIASRPKWIYQEPPA